MVSFLLIAFFTVYSLLKNPHRFSDSECTNCHVKKPAGGDAVAGAKAMVAPVSTLCGNCHTKIAETYSHPINIVPRGIVIPEDFPLSYRYVLTCSSCHDIHSSPVTPYGTDSNLLRRYASGRSFCIICHDESRLSHKTTMTEAHMQSNYIEQDPAGTIDPMSANCISCHDGSYATSVSIKTGLWQHNKEFIRFDKGNHPIGVDYETARTIGKRKTDLKPFGALDPRLKFFDGKVGCGTCHDPYSPIKAQLVITDEESRLCLECHMVDK